MLYCCYIWYPHLVSELFETKLDKIQTYGYPNNSWKKILNPWTSFWPTKRNSKHNVAAAILIAQLMSSLTNASNMTCLNIVVPSVYKQQLCWLIMIQQEPFQQQRKLLKPIQWICFALQIQQLRNECLLQSKNHNSSFNFNCYNIKQFNLSQIAHFWTLLTSRKEMILYIQSSLYFSFIYAKIIHVRTLSVSRLWLYISLKTVCCLHLRDTTLTRSFQLDIQL